MILMREATVCFACPARRWWLTALKRVEEEELVQQMVKKLFTNGTTDKKLLEGKKRKRSALQEMIQTAGQGPFPCPCYDML